MKPRFLILIFFLILIPSAFAELTVTVYPGYTFTSGEAPTTSKLNRLGRPTIYVTGTLSGTNALGAETVNGVHLNSGVVGSNITFDGSSPRKLVIANDGVGALQIASTMAGPGLSGGSGSIFTVLVDSNSIVNLGDVLAVGSSLSNANLSATAAISPWKLAFTTNTLIGATEYGTNNFLSLSNLLITGSTLAPKQYYSNNITWGTGNLLDTPHGLGYTPRFVRAVIRCGTAEDGYVAGDELGLDNVQSSGGAPFFSCGANASNVWLTARSGVDPEYLNRSTGALAEPDEAGWTLTIVAW